jgi:hypothetical protein
MRPAANSTASSVNLSAEPASYPQIPQTKHFFRWPDEPVDKKLESHLATFKNRNFDHDAVCFPEFVDQLFRICEMQYLSRTAATLVR